MNTIILDYKSSTLTYKFNEAVRITNEELERLRTSNDISDTIKEASRDPKFIREIFERTLYKLHMYWTFVDGNGYDAIIRSGRKFEMKISITQDGKIFQWTGSKHSDKVPEHLLIHLQVNTEGLIIGKLMVHASETNWEKKKGDNCGYSNLCFLNECEDLLNVLVGSTVCKTKKIHFIAQEHGGSLN